MTYSIRQGDVLTQLAEITDGPAVEAKGTVAPVSRQPKADAS